MNTKDIAISVLAVSLLVTGVLFFKAPAEITVNVPPAQNTVLGSAGAYHTERVDFAGGATVASNFDLNNQVLNVNSSDNLETLTGTQVCDGSEVIAVTFEATTGGVLTLPTGSSTVQAECFKQGARKTFLIRNASTSPIGFAVGASSTLITSASTSVNVGQPGTTTIQFGNFAEVTGYLITSSTPWSATGQPWVIWKVVPLLGKGN